jgi:hypothetical protein
LAWLPAANIGYYRDKSGDVPQESLLGMVRVETLDEASTRMLLHGRRHLLSQRCPG